MIVGICENAPALMALPLGLASTLTQGLASKTVDAKLKSAP